MCADLLSVGHVVFDQKSRNSGCGISPKLVSDGETEFESGGNDHSWILMGISSKEKWKF